MEQIFIVQARANRRTNVFIFKSAKSGGTFYPNVVLLFYILQIKDGSDCGYLNGYVAGIAGSLHGEAIAPPTTSVSSATKIRLSEPSGSLVEVPSLVSANFQLPTCYNHVL